MNETSQGLRKMIFSAVFLAVATNVQAQQLVYQVVPYNDFEVMRGEAGRWSIDGGTITTDGTLGKISPAVNFFDWEIDVTANGFNSGTITPSNSSVGGSLNASDSGLSVLGPDDSLRLDARPPSFILDGVSATWGPLDFDVRLFCCRAEVVDAGQWAISALKGPPNNVAVIVPEPSPADLLPIGIALLVFPRQRRVHT